MDKMHSTTRPQLFVLRLWLAESGDGTLEWRGVIENAGRERRYFREWQVLLDFLQHCCQEAERQTKPTDEIPPSI